MNENKKTILSITDNMYLINPNYYNEWIEYINTNAEDNLNNEFLKELLNGLLLMEISTPDKLEKFYQKENLSNEIINSLVELIIHFSNKGEDLKKYWHSKNIGRN